MSDHESDDDDELRAPAPPPEADDNPLQAHYAPDGLFSVPDASKLVLPAQLAAGDKRSAAVLTNTIIIFDALQQLVRELGPAFKKVRTNARVPRDRSSETTAREYKKKFLDAEQLWFAMSILENKSTKALWGSTLDVKEKNTVVTGFMLRNKIEGAGAERIFRQTLNKFATNKKLVLKSAMCGSILIMAEVQKKVPLPLSLFCSILSFRIEFYSPTSVMCVRV